MARAKKSRFLGRWALFLLLLLVAIVLTERVAERYDTRIDLTDAKLHTLSPETRRLLARIDDRVTITYYASERVPAGFQNLRHDTIDVLSELERASGGRVEVRVIDPYTLIEEKVAERRRAFEAGETEDPLEDAPENVRTPDNLSSEAELRRRRWAEEEKEKLKERGIPEIRGPSVGEGSVGFVFFYSAIELRYLDRAPAVIPVHSSLVGLEYELASRIARLVRSESPKIALFLGRPDDRMTIPANPQTGQGPQVVHVYEALKQVLAREFEVETITITDDDSCVPADAKLLIVADPDALTERQRYEIDRSVVQGRPALFLVSTVSGDLRQHQGPFFTRNPGLDPLFEKWGVSIGREIISSFEAGRIEMIQRDGRGNPQRARQEYPLAPLISGPGLNPDSPLTVGLPNLVFPFASAFRPNDLVLERVGLTFTPLATTDPISWNTAFKPELSPGMVRPPMESARQHKFILASILEGTFPTAYPAGDPVPRWPAEVEAVDGDLSALPPPEIVPALEPAPGRVVLVGSSDLAKMVPLSMFQSSGNFLFLAGVVESLTLGQDLVNIRAKRPMPRPLEETTARERWIATYGNVVGVPLLILVLALARFAIRRASARAFETRIAREGS